MKRIVLRGVVTFFNINRNKRNEVPYEMEDLVNEIYMVLDICAEKFDTKLKNDFYLYFSRSVSNRVSRMAKYKKLDNDEITFSRYASMMSTEEDVDVEGLLEDKHVVSDDSQEFMEHLNNMQWTDLERGILDSIQAGRSVRDILGENNITRTEYDDALQKIQMKLKCDDAMNEVVNRLENKWKQDK